MANSGTYRVVSGDTLYSIAKRNGLTVDELKSLNSLKNNNLEVGQILKISKASPSLNLTNGNQYTVQSGDTLALIAKKFGISVETLRALNGISPSQINNLKVGQVLKISGSAPATPAPPPIQPTPVLDEVLNKKVQFGVNFSGGIITGMTSSETRAYAANVAYTESKYRYQVENAYGYMGLYQFGAVALVEAGLISRAKYNEAVKIHGGKLANGANPEIHKAFIANPDNWIVGYNKQVFLNNPSVQHRAFVTYTNNNIQYATAAAKKIMNGNIAKIAAYMKMAHLLGPYRASEGTVNPKFDSTDKNQTSMQEYGQGVANEIKTLAKLIDAQLQSRRS